jgi:hypothetical protein
MVEDLKQYELDRVVNTIKSFGWSLVSSSIEENKVKAEFQKVLEGMSADMKKFELDRIAGMIKNVGWDVVSSRFEDSRTVVSFEKIVKAVA